MKDRSYTRLAWAAVLGAAVVVACADTALARHRRGGADFSFTRGRAGRHIMPRRAETHDEWFERRGHFGSWRRGGYGAYARNRHGGSHHGDYVPHRRLFGDWSGRGRLLRFGRPHHGRRGGFSIIIVIR